MAKKYDKVLLEVKNLDVRYQRVILAVRGISFKVHEHEFVSLIGSNGAGKSTTLKAISAFQPKHAGQVIFNGEDITNTKPHEILRKGMAHCPEGRLVFPKLTIARNIRLGAYTRRDKDGIKEDMEHLYEMFPVLYSRRNHHAGKMSGGEQMMVAIARSVMSRPKLLLMDAPSQGLAPLVIKQVGAVLEKLNDEGMAVLLVDQNARLCLRLANRTYLLEVGQIVMHGDSKEMAENPKVQKSYLGVD